MSYPLTNLSPGDMQIYDHSTPGLHAGKYQIDITQALPNAVTDQFSQTIQQEFIVDAPQFSIGSSEIHALFPGDQTNGFYSFILPYVTLETPALPWERLIDKGQPATIPWMALLILSTDEITPDPATGSPLTNSTVQDFLKADPKIVKPGILSSSLSPETLQSRMNSILLPTGTFTLVCPRLQELASLAHVREIDPVSQVVSGTKGDSWYSELLANRFPISVNATDSSGMKNYALVVSLEGLSKYLVDTPVWPAGADHIQLVVLSSWTFISAKQPGQTFTELATHLSKQAASPNSADTLLAIPVTQNGSEAAKRIKEGYTALCYHTEPGDETFSWYRGPFSPYPAQTLPSSVPNTVHPSQVLIYDRLNAIFDTSYSAAWSIGRLMALSDPAYIDTLQTTRRRIVQQNAKLLQRSKMPHLSGITDLSVLASSGLTKKIFAGKIEAGMGTDLAAALQSRPDPDIRVTKSAPVNHLFPDKPMPAAFSAQTRWFMEQPEVGRFLVEDSASGLEPVSDWLAQLVLLDKVPFSHLVPDPRMLPQESIRFFYVDSNWLKALFDGAISIGVHSSQAKVINDLIAPSLWKDTQTKATAIRSKLLRASTGMPAGRSTDESTNKSADGAIDGSAGRLSDASRPTGALPAAGMLIRSALITGWPGLQINATAGGNAVNRMRMAHLSPTVLLVLLDKIPDTVTISQPQQGISFGVTDTWVSPLRSLAASNLGATLGKNFPEKGTYTQFMRTDGTGANSNVLNIMPPETKSGTNSGTNAAGHMETSIEHPESSVGYLIPVLTTALGLKDPLTPAQFAVEMLQTPEEIIFTPPKN